MSSIDESPFKNASEKAPIPISHVEKISENDRRAFIQANDDLRVKVLHLGILQMALQADQQMIVLNAHLKEKYLLGENDRVNMYTGVIQRREKE